MPFPVFISKRENPGIEWRDDVSAITVPFLLCLCCFFVCRWSTLRLRFVRIYSIAEQTLHERLMRAQEKKDQAMRLCMWCYRVEMTQETGLVDSVLFCMHSEFVRFFSMRKTIHKQKHQQKEWAFRCENKERKTSVWVGNSKRTASGDRERERARKGANEWKNGQSEYECEKRE